MRLTLLTCLSSFVLVNLVCTQAVTAAPPSPANKPTNKPGSGVLNVYSPPAKDGSEAGYRLLAKVIKKNQAKYGRKNIKNSSQKLKYRKNKR